MYSRITLADMLESGRINLSSKEVEWKLQADVKIRDKQIIFKPGNINSVCRMRE